MATHNMENRRLTPPAAPLSAPPSDLLTASVLLLDFDGTLVEIADRPDAVRVDDRLRRLLGRLRDRLQGRIALVSGRPAAEVAALAGIDGVTIVGSHGMEFRWGDGRTAIAERPASMASIVGAMRDLAARSGGVIVEDKPLGAALHYRQAPESESACIDLATSLAAAHGLHLQSGKMMVEVRAAGGDKGSAIGTLMREPAFAAMRPLFMGDDLTDEPGFVAATDLGGAGIFVGAPRRTAARYRLADVPAALAWLEAACERLQ